MKKIILNKRQLSEVIGADFTYLNKDGDGFKEYVGDTEIVTSPHISDDENGEPLTTDKYAKEMAPRYYYGYKGAHGVVRCGKEQTRPILESNKDLDNKIFRIPDKLFLYLKKLSTKYGDQKSGKGFKRLNNLINNRDLSSDEMYVLKHFFDNSNSQSDEYNIIGGDKLRDWIDKELEAATSISYRNKDSKRKAGISNAFINPHSKESGNNKAHVSNSQKIENGVKFTYE